MSLSNRTNEERLEAAQSVVNRFGGDLSAESLYRNVHANVPLEEIITLFRTGSVGFYKIGQDLIKKNIGKPDLQKTLAREIISGESGALPILKILATLDLPPSQELQEALVSTSIQGQPIMSEAATKVVALRYKNEIPRLLEIANAGIRHGLNYAQDPNLVEPLLRAWGVVDDPDCDVRPPVGLGLLLTPYALADIWRQKSHLGYQLARAYGYIDDSQEKPNQITVQSYCELLKRGFTAINPGFFERDVSELQIIEGQFIKTLMPWSTGMTGSIPEGFDPHDNVWQTLFLSAVRASETTNFDIKRDELPYSETGQENIKWAEFSYTPMSYARRELINKPINDFKALGLRADFLPQFLFEYAVCRLEREARSQEEQLLFFDARWALSAQNGKPPEKITNFPIREYDDAHSLKDLVVPRRPRSPIKFTDTVTQAGNSVQRLLQATNRTSLTELIPSIDNHCRSILPSIGIEIQCPFDTNRRTESLAWKQALRSFGIPSPRRPEYKSMVEASFPPGYSFQMHIAGIDLLKELGFFRSGQDLALHVSLSGELGIEVRYILFTQQCVQRPTNSPPGAWLMSKGFAHLHEDSINPINGQSDKSGLKRTELRSMRIIAEDLVSTPIPACFDDIACIHLLGGALASKIPALNSLWSSFKLEIDKLVEAMPDSMKNWLNANWYERVGDSFDRQLMHTLPIMKLRKAALQWMNEENRRSKLREQFLEVRNRHAKTIFEAMPKTAVYKDHIDLFTVSPAGLPLFIPTLSVTTDV